MKTIFYLLVAAIFISCGNKPDARTKYFPKETALAGGAGNKQNVWVFVLAGQSNMAGRGLVEPGDTIIEKRLLTFNKEGQLIFTKEPLHFYEPNLAGLDCGYSFGTSLLKHIPDSISVLLIPTAVGGSSISQWLGDSVHRNVRLYSNFLNKLEKGETIWNYKGDFLAPGGK